MSATTSEKQVKNDITVIQIHSGESDGTELVFEWNGKRIAVSLSTTQASRDCQKGRYKLPR